MSIIVKIPLEELEEGMVVVKFDKGGFSFPYYGHPFPDKVLKQYLLKNGVQNAYIRKPKPVEPPAEAPKQETVATKSEPSTKTENIKFDTSAFTENLVRNGNMSDIARQIPMIREMNAVSAVHKKAKEVTTMILKEARMGKVVDTDKAKNVVEDLIDQCMKSPEAFVTMTRLKDFDNYTFTHSVNVSVLAIAIGRKLGTSEQEMNNLGFAGLLHDIGKMMIPEAIINKPTKLTDGEFEIIKKHPEYGFKYLAKDKSIDEEILFAVRHHHEKADGSGYPNSLTDTDISKFAKIISIADVYDAVTSDRSYHKGMVPSDALKMIYSWSGRHFNDSLVKFFISIMGIYPVGTLVVLNSNELAIILEPSKNDPMRPKVLIISNAKMEPVRPYFFDLMSYNVVTGLPYKSIISSLDAKDFSIDSNRIIEQYAEIMKKEEKNFPHEQMNNA